MPRVHFVASQVAALIGRHRYQVRERALLWAANARENPDSRDLCQELLTKNASVQSAFAILYAERDALAELDAVRAAVQDAAARREEVEEAKVRELAAEAKARADALAAAAEEARKRQAAAEADAKAIAQAAEARAREAAARVSAALLKAALEAAAAAAAAAKADAAALEALKASEEVEADADAEDDAGDDASFQSEYSTEADAEIHALEMAQALEEVRTHGEGASATACALVQRAQMLVPSLLAQAASAHDSSLARTAKFVASSERAASQSAQEVASKQRRADNLRETACDVSDMSSLLQAAVLKKRGRDEEAEVLDSAEKRLCTPIAQRNAETRQLLEDEYDITGKIDGYNAGAGIVEVKTRKHWFTLPPDYDIIQLRTYLRIFNEPRGTLLEENAALERRRETAVQNCEGEWALIHRALCDAARAVREAKEADICGWAQAVVLANSANKQRARVRVEVAITKQALSPKHRKGPEIRNV